ncbi:MAG: penicillin acylase family protein [Balneolaceae bacterium]
MKFIFRILLFLFILAIGFAVVGFYFTFYKGLPNHNTELQIEGINDAVDVHWDPYGVPHIYADNEDDLFYTIGYMHAQDRLWQMTLSQLLIEGRFAEFLGEELIEFDEHQRTIGLWETAKKIEAEAPDSLIQILEHYSDGVNEYISQNEKTVPIEMTLLDMEPLEWTPTHSIAMSRLMAWDQNIHWWSELTFAYLEDRVDSQKLESLFPFYDDEYPTSLNSEETRLLTASAMPMLDQEFKLRSILSKNGTNSGSNAWALNGSKTESGQPILAGDPHMGLSLPGYWYEAHFSSPTFNITGATIPGAPFVVLGQTENIAWSITNSMADDTDFFVEQINPENSNQYIADSSNGEAVFREIQWRDEIIRVKDGDDHFYRIPHTQHGPVINTIHPSKELIADKMVTMKWVGHEVSHELWSLYKLNKAQNITQFKDALTEFNSPAMNFIYADRSDNIALFSVGNLPIRDYNPILFRKGWDPSYNWQDWIPFDEMPHVENPAKGFVAHSNNKLHTDDYPYYISTFWEPPSRILRVTDLINARDSINVNYTQDMQQDVVSELAREILDIVLPQLRSAERNNEFSDVFPYLENWDYTYSLNSTAASIFDLFLMNLSQNILQDDMGTSAYESLIRMEHLPVTIVLNLLKDETSFVNLSTDEQSISSNEVLRESMIETIDQLTETYGDEPFQWRWESLHTLTLKPPMLGEAADQPEASATLKMIVENLLSKGPYPAVGNGMTINKGQYSWQEPFEMNLGPAIRRIVDFSQPHRSYSVLATGQSGNPLSAHFGDQTDFWLDGRYRYIYQDSTFFQQSNYETTRLIPAN